MGADGQEEASRQEGKDPESKTQQGWSIYHLSEMLA